MNEMDDNLDADLPDEDEIVSKSAIKREFHELQAIGERLAEMSSQEWEQFPFSQIMLEALQESKRIKAHGARRRHFRRLGKLLRDEDSDAIQILLNRMDEKHLLDTKRFHQLERWRDRLLENGDRAVTEFLVDYPQADRQQIRQLVRQALKEKEANKPPKAYRKLFQYLKSL